MAGTWNLALFRGEDRTLELRVYSQEDCEAEKVAADLTGSTFRLSVYPDGSQEPMDVLTTANGRAHLLAGDDEGRNIIKLDFTAEATAGYTASRGTYQLFREVEDEGRIDSTLLLAGRVAIYGGSR